MHIKQLLAAAVTSAALVAAGLSLGAGTAAALPSQPHQWCPGDSMQSPSGPGSWIVWDMNVCHTWQYVRWGGNASKVDFDGTIVPATSVWDGPSPPPDSAPPVECGTGLFGEGLTC